MKNAMIILLFLVSSIFHHAIAHKLMKITSGANTYNAAFLETPVYGKTRHDFVHWETAITIPLSTNQNGAGDGIPVEGTKASIMAAAQAWQDVSTAYIGFSDAGLTPNGFSSTDGLNVMCFAEAGDPAFETWLPSDGVIAITVVTINANQELLDVDIIFNGRDYVWNIGSGFDIQAIATHELGHLLGIHHSDVLYFSDMPPRPTPTMHGGYVPGELHQQTLESDDREAVTFLYPQTTFTPPVAPTLQSPTNNSGGISVCPLLLTWDPVPGATSYWVRVFQSGNETAYAIDYSGFSGTSFFVWGGWEQNLGFQNLEGDRTYGWNVTAYNNGIPGPTSETRTFTTIRRGPTLTWPPMPGWYQPKTLSLHWNPIPGANFYQLQIRVGGGFTYSWPSSIADETNILGTSKQFTLDTDIGYQWRVRAVDVPSDWTYWVDNHSFSTVTLVSSNNTWYGDIALPEPTTINNGVTLILASGTNLTIPTGSSLNVNGTLQIQSDVSILGEERVVIGPTGAVRVEAIATAATNITNNSFTANWDVAPLATKYYLDVATDNGFTSFVSGYPKDVGNVASYDITSLNPNTIYFYKVRPWNTSGESGNSNTVSVTTTTGSVINQNTTWSGNFTLTQSVTVNSGVTLTVNPGTSITFSPGVIITIYGNLDMQGTSSQRITLDGQNYAPPTSTQDYWQLALLRFLETGSGTITYSDFTSAKYQVFGQSTGSLTVQNCTFSNFGFTGGYGGNGGNAIEVFYDIASPPLAMGALSITNNTFTGTTKLGYGIVVANVQPSTMTITGNAIQDCYMGILAHKMGGTIGANTVTGCANGVVANSQSPTFTGLTASGNDKSFFLENASNATVTNCTITGVVQQGIYVKTGSTPLIQTNSISGQSGSSAIYAVDAATNPRVRSNAISNIIEGVTVTGGAGARIGEDCGGSNTFTNCGTAVAVMSSAGAVEAKHNSISGTSGLGEGIRLQAGGVVQNNLIQNRLMAISVYNVLPTSIVLNEIQNSGYGLFLSNLASPTYSYDLSLNNIVGVSTYHVQNTSSVSVSLSSNWWGVCSEQDVQKSGPVTLTSILQSPQAGTGPCASSGGGTGCPANDLVAYWALDGNLTDGSGNNNGAQGVGVSYATGIVGQGLQLSGGTGSFAYASDQVYYHITNPTVQAWVKPSSVGTAMTIISEDIQGAWADGRGFFMDVNGGKVRLIVGNAAGWKVATGATSLQAGTWYHVAGVYDGTSVKIYLNGQIDGSNSIGAVTISYNPITTLGPNPSTYYIGINHNANNTAPTTAVDLAYPFQGLIDEVRVYNRPLSASEIQQYYNETATPASITVTSPNGGESFSGGGQTNILWSSQSVSQNVQIEYSTDAGSSWTLIVGDLQNSGTYTWTMPSISSTQCKVRVSAMTGSPTDQSDGLFTIASGDASLVAHWKFESNLNDESTSNNPLTGVGTSYTTGHTSQGLSLNGTTGSFAHTTDQTYYHPSNPSVEAWIKMQGTSAHVSIVTEGIQGAWADGRGYFLDVLNGKARFVIGSAGWKVAQSATTLQLDTWYHVVGTYEGSTLKIYVNGQLDGSNNIGTVSISYAPMANAGPNPSTMYVGIQHNSNNSSPTATSDLYFPFQGVVDEVRIYNRVLTATEVQQHYTGFFGKRAFQDTSKILPPAIADNVPREFGLFQNHPNPFNPETVIRYAVPVQSHVTLRVYDVLGRLVKTLVSTSLKDGFHSVTWDGRDENGRPLSSGMYLCHMIAWGEVEGQQNQFADTRKLILNK